MTELLYLPDADYEKEFDTEVSKSKSVDGYIVLEETLFYPEGGGQPADHGKIYWGDGREAEITDVQKEDGEVRHFIDLDATDDWPDSGTNVHGEINWERRYNHMKMHTAVHVVSKVVNEEFGAQVAGNQIHEERSRIDFKPVEFNDSDLERIESAANSLISEEYIVDKEMVDRDDLRKMVDENSRVDLEMIPDHVDPIRVVRFEDDIMPCGGTHVDNLKEIGEVKVVNRESKGTETERIEFVLEN